MTHNYVTLSSTKISDGVTLEVIHDKDSDVILIAIRCNFRYPEKYEILCEKLKQVTGEEWNLTYVNGICVSQVLIAHNEGFDRTNCLSKLVKTVVDKLNRVNIGEIVKQVKRMKVKKK